MDNFSLDVTSQGEKSLEDAVRLAWADRSGRMAVHYYEAKLKEHVKYYGPHEPDHSYEHEVMLKQDPEGVPTMILLWTETPETQRLPYPLNREEATAFLSGWLKRVDYGRQPDHDGDNEKGWRIFTRTWGLNMHHYTILALQPAWAMYGK